MRLTHIKKLLTAPKNAEQLFLVVTPTSLSLDKDYDWKDGRDTFTVEVWKQKGDDEPTKKDMGDYSVHVFKNGSSTESVIKRNTNSFSVTASRSDKSYDVRLKVGEAYVHTVTVSVTKDGTNGNPGTPGTPGTPGGNTATLLLYKRSATAITAIDWTYSVTYTFVSKALDRTPDGWTLNMIPAGTDPIYVTAATAYGTGTTDSIAASEWATPVLFSQNGEDGEHGNDGLNTASVFLYKRSESTPTKPRYNLVYTFATGVLVGNLDGWTQSIPETDGKPCWVIQATAISTASADQIVSTEWSEAKKLVADGETGVGVTDEKTYYLATTMASGVTRSTDQSSWTTTYQKATADKPYVWRYKVTWYSDGTIKYTDCELVFSYSGGSNSNLLEQTNFSSVLAMDKWTTISKYVKQDGFSGTLPDVTLAAGVTTGLQARNAYHDECEYGTTSVKHKIVLEQPIKKGSVAKIEPSTWYTLSFWMKTTKQSSDVVEDGFFESLIFPTCVDTTKKALVDGETVTLGANGLVAWGFSSAWVQHSLTFRTKATIGSEDQYLQFRLLPAAADGMTRTVSICMPKLEVGMQATGYLSNDVSIHTGQPRRRRWALNTEYMAGGVDEPYLDAVLFVAGNETAFYRCIKSHISTEDNKPTGTDGAQYWTSENSAHFENLSTDLFFATKAYVDNLIATLIQTGYEGSPHIEAEGSEFKIFGRGQYPAIYLAVNSDNKAVLRFQNENTGEFLYDLGPDGIMKEFTEVADSYTKYSLYKLTEAKRVSELLDITDSMCTNYYRFNEGYKQIGTGSTATKKYHVSGTSSPSAKNASYFTVQSYSGSTIRDGWYCKANNGIYRMFLLNNISSTVLYTVNIYQFSGGKLISNIIVYFKDKTSSYALNSVGCDKNGNELDSMTYPYLYSYGLTN